MNYGKELILDLYGCNAKLFTRQSIKLWLEELCERINMTRGGLHFWDYEDGPEGKANAPDHLAGTSAVQFITTSDIVIHTIDRLQECYINIFTCKAFDQKMACDFTVDYFEAKFSEVTTITRGRQSRGNINNTRVCRKCGCTDDNCGQCIAATGKPCHWVEPDLCSRCKDEMEATVDAAIEDFAAQAKAEASGNFDIPGAEAARHSDLTRYDDPEVSDE